MNFKKHLLKILPAVNAAFLACNCSLVSKCNAVKIELFSDDCSFIVDTEKGTASLWKIYIGAREKKVIIVPRSVEFVDSNFEVVDVYANVVENVKNRLIKLFLPSSLQKSGVLGKIKAWDVDVSFYDNLVDINDSDNSDSSTQT